MLIKIGAAGRIPGGFRVPVRDSRGREQREVTGCAQNTRQVFPENPEARLYLFEILAQFQLKEFKRIFPLRDSFKYKYSNLIERKKDGPHKKDFLCRR
jgi:hypothetical protein